MVLLWFCDEVMITIGYTWGKNGESLAERRLDALQKGSELTLIMEPGFGEASRGSKPLQL